MEALEKAKYPVGRYLPPKDLSPTVINHFMQSLSMDDWQRTFIHPESNKAITLAKNVSLYAWHGESSPGPDQSAESIERMVG